MMNLKKSGGGKKKSGCGCGGSKKGKKVVFAPAVEMVDAPDAEPGFGEPQLEFTDSGHTLEPMGLDSAGSMFD